MNFKIFLKRLQIIEKRKVLNSLKIGLLAEDKAVKYLENIGFQILDRNFHTRYGEVDIISKKDKDEVLHFIEVKSGNSFNPAYNLTEKKIEKILKTVDIYLNKKNCDLDISIDLITVTKNSIEFFENITI